MDLGRGRVEAAASRGLPGAICGLDGVGPQGDMGWGLPISLNRCSFRVGCEGSGINTGKMVPICRLPWRKDRQRNDGSCPSSPLSGSTLLSLSKRLLCLLHLPSCQGACLQAKLCAGPLSWTSGCSGSFCLTRMARIPTDFYSQILWELLFLGLHLWAGAPLYGAWTPLSFGAGGPSAAAFSLLVLNGHVLVGAGQVILATPTRLDVAFS